MMRFKVLILIFLLISFCLIYGDGDTQWPIGRSDSNQDTFTSAFGPRVLTGYDFHRGLDIAASANTPVYPSHEGTGYVFPNTSSFGINVKIHGESISSVYAHLNSYTITNGQEITSLDTQIGLSGNTTSGNPVGYHLHLGICTGTSWDNDNAIHPSTEIDYNDNSAPIAFLEDGHNYYDWTTQIAIDGYELDLKSFTLHLQWFHPPEYYTDTEYDIDFANGINCPHEDYPGHGIISVLESSNPYFDNTQWSMEIWADDFEYQSDDNQILHFRIYRQDANENIQLNWMTICFEEANGDYILTNRFRPDDPTGTNSNQIKQIVELFPNYPNPFNPETTIGYQILDPSRDYRVKITNVKGQLVKDYEINSLSGKGSIVWNGTNIAGDQVGSGVYFYRIEADNHVIETRKMSLIK